MPILHFDFETRSAADLKRVGAHVYAAHATTDVRCCAYVVDDGEVQLWTPGMPVPPEFIAAANNSDWIVVAHNARFERLIMQHIMAPRYGWPVIPLAQQRCTMASALSLALPPGLEKVAKALGLEHQKDAAGARLMKEMSRPRDPRDDEDPNGIYWVDDPEKIERLHRYCIQDVEAERALHKRIGFLPPAEQLKWEHDALVNARGVYIDGELLSAALRAADECEAEIKREISELTAGKVTSISQTKRLINWMAEHGLKVEDVRKPTLEKELLNGGSPEVKRAMELRLAGASAAAKKLRKLQDWRGADGRVRGGLIYHGSATGRWSSWDVQLHNLKKPTSDIGAVISEVLK
jgi:DNA polymerase bacteriophage-type